MSEQVVETPAQTAIRFEDFWSAYPGGRKTNKKGCRDKWRAKRLDEKADVILEDVRWRASYHEPWLKDDGKFIPMPSTYLSQERWNDDRVDVRDKRRERATAPSETQRPKDDGPPMSRWAIGANRIMWKLAYEDSRRGFQPIGEDRLKTALRMKREIVESAEQADRDGNRWTDEEFIDVCKETFEKLFLGQREAA